MANNCVTINSLIPNKGNYLLSMTAFKYAVEDQNGNSKIYSLFLPVQDVVSEDIANLVSQSGLDLVVVTQKKSGLTIGVNRLAVQGVKKNLSDGTATVEFKDKTSIDIQEAFSVVEPFFTAVPGYGAGGPVLVDGVTIVGDGVAIALEVGIIDTININDSAITLAKIQDISANRLLGRNPSSSGPPQEIILGAGLELSGTTLNLTNGPPIYDMSNIGGGAGVFSAIVSEVAQLRTLVGVGRIGAAVVGDTIEISTTAQLNQGVNLNAGDGQVFAQMNGENLEFRTLEAGAGIILIQTPTKISLSAILQDADNGLYIDATTIKLGTNPLVENTDVNKDGFDFSISGAGDVTIEGDVITVAANTSLQQTSAGDIASIATTTNDVTGPTEVNLNSPVVRLGDIGGASVVSVGDQYDFPAPAPSLPSPGDTKIMRWRNDTGTIVPEFVNEPSGGGSGTNRAWFDITPVDPNFRSVLVEASGSGVTVNINSSNEWFFIIPDGVDLYGGSIFHEIAGNPGANVYLRFTFNGLAADGNARVSNISLASTRVPAIELVNMAVIDFGGPTRLIPAARNEWQGASYPKVYLTSDIDTDGYLEIEVRTYNGNLAAGNNQAICNFRF